MHTLSSLISALKSMSDEKKSQSEILGWLYDYVTQYGIKMQYAECMEKDPDESDNLSNQIQLVDGEYIPYNITSSENKTVNKFTKFTYLEPEHKIVYKIILSYIREYNHGLIHHMLVNECNGAVIDSLSWTLLVRPPKIFNEFTQSMTESINIGLSDESYELIKIIDGTMVTIYNNNHPLYGPIWCISTSNGYDVSYIRWMGPNTYSEIVYELLSRYDDFMTTYGMSLVNDKLCTGDTRLEFSNLDPLRCYSFIIRTHHFHPLYQDPEGIWAICQWGLTEPVDMLSIPSQIIYSVRDFKIKHNIKGNLLVDKIESIINHECVILPDIPTRRGGIKTIHYGYLLQSKKHSTSDVISDCNLNVMIDSNLLKRIRDAIYKYPTAIIRDSLSHNNRTEYFIMKAFLTPINHIEFLLLFPHFKFMFDKFQIIFDSVVTTILHMRQMQIMSDTMVEGVDTTSPLNCVSSLLLDYIIKRDLTFNPINADAKKIIRDFILKSEYAMIFLKLI